MESTKSDAVYHVQVKSGKTQTVAELPVHLTRDQLAAIDGTSPNVHYYGKLTIVSGDEALKLAHRVGSTDNITFDTTDIVAITPVSGSYRDVHFNKVVSIGANKGCAYFVGLKITVA